MPKFVGSNARGLLEGLLRREAAKRLGTAGDAPQVRRHRFFRGLDFRRVLARGYTPEFTPPMRDESDTTNFDTAFTDEPVRDSAGNIDLVLDTQALEEASVGWDTAPAAPGAAAAPAQPASPELATDALR